MPAGRPPEYNIEIIAKSKEYLAITQDGINGVGKIEVNIPSIEGLALHLGISRETCYAWEKEEGKEEFSDIMSQLRSEQAKRLLNNGLAGTYNPTIAKLMLSKHGYVEKSETDQHIKADLNVNMDVKEAIDKAVEEL